MSYEAIEAEVQTALKTLTGFTTGVTLDDAQKANRGVSKFIRLEYGGFRQVQETFNAFQQVTWTIEIHLYVRFKNAAQIRDDLREARMLIINLLNSHPRLNGDAFDSFVTRGVKGNEDIVMGQVRFFEEILYLEASEALEIAPVD